MGNGKKILVVDDTAYLRKIIKEELESGGYEVELAEDGINALAKVSSFQPDLITLDIEMPKLDGFSTCEKLYSQHYSKFTDYRNFERLPIVFVTSKDDFKERQRGFELGATDFITKPFMKGELLNIVNNILFPDNVLEDMTVLVVDDSRTSRAIVVNSLKRHGVKIFESDNGKDAFDIICKQMEDIDMIISDLEMPLMNGEELCSKVRYELGLRDLPFILMSGADKSNLLKVFKAGGTDYLTKPFLKEELIARVTVQMEKAKLLKRTKEYMKELEYYSKMKDDLIAVCSHDLRSPLSNILGFSDILRTEGSLSEEDLESVAFIKESGEILLNLINDILDLTKIQSKTSEIETRPISMSEVVEISRNAFRQLIKDKNLAVVLNDNAKKNIVSGNSNCLIRVVNNILSNAIKFTPEGGSIELNLENDEKSVILHIKDSGIGIKEENIPLLFDKFTKTSQRGTKGEAGTGLGMSIVKELIEQHAGSIEVKSKIDAGTTFTIKLPHPLGENIVAEKIIDADPGILV